MVVPYPGGPIGNGQMVADDGQMVRFRSKDYKHDRPDEVNLLGEKGLGMRGLGEVGSVKFGARLGYEIWL